MIFQQLLSLSLGGFKATGLGLITAWRVPSDDLKGFKDVRMKKWPIPRPECGLDCLMYAAAKVDDAGGEAVDFWRCPTCRSRMQPLMIYKLGFDQDYYTLTLISLIKIGLCSKCPRIHLIKYKCFEMRSGGWSSRSTLLLLVLLLLYHARPFEPQSKVNF